MNIRRTSKAAGLLTFALAFGWVYVPLMVFQPDSPEATLSVGRPSRVANGTNGFTLNVLFTNTTQNPLLVQAWMEEEWETGFRSPIDTNTIVKVGLVSPGARVLIRVPEARHASVPKARVDLLVTPKATFQQLVLDRGARVLERFTGISVSDWRLYMANNISPER